MVKDRALKRPLLRQSMFLLAAPPILLAVAFALAVGFVRAADSNYGRKRGLSAVVADLATLSKSRASSTVATTKYVLGHDTSARADLERAQAQGQTALEDLELTGDIDARELQRLRDIVAQRSDLQDRAVSRPPGDPSAEDDLAQSIELGETLTTSIDQTLATISAAELSQEGDNERLSQALVAAYGVLLLLGLAASTAVFFFLHGRVRRRLDEVRVTIDAIAKGRRPDRVEEERHDELSAFAQHLVRIGDRLVSRDEGLREALGAQSAGLWEVDIDPVLMRMDAVGGEKFPRGWDQVSLDPVHADDRERVAAAFGETVRTHVPATIKFRGIRPSGRECFYEARGAFVETSADRRLIGVTINVTDRHRAEAAAEAARAEAVAATAAKSEFLSRINHELRTPLNAVCGFAELLEESDLNAVQRDQVGYIRRSADLLMTLVADLLDLSRMETGRLAVQLESVPLAETVEYIVASYRPIATEHDIELSVVSEDRDVHVLVDPARLSEVVLNLLSNAVRYNHAGGRIDVRIDSGHDRRARVTVRDTGPGIAAEDFERVFEPFERLDAASRGVEGVGLGLTISRALAEAMGGSLSVTGVEDEGSTFTLELGVTDQRPRAGTADGTDGDRGSNGTSPWRVVAIEDDGAARHLLESAFAGQPDLRLVTAATGHQGLVLVGTEHPDVVLLDVNLPDIDGAEVLRRLRAEDDTARVPVLVVTADTTARTRSRLVAAGAQAVVTKPFGAKRLLALVRSVARG